MPVRWALFNPNNTSQALLATEAGVWSTDNLNGSLTNWAASNSGMGNVRTDMLQYRSSDNLVLAATHGRGLFSSDIFTSVTADFGVAQTVGYTGKAIRFYDDSYQASSWLWNFGDGNTSSAQNPTHAYNAPGDYTVTLTINGGAASKSKTSFVRILPDQYIPFTLADGGDFESNAEYFGANTISGFGFERGNSSIAGKNGTNSGSFAWVTGLTANEYQNFSDVQLWTPNFNMSVAGAYTLSFYAKYQTEWYSSNEAYDGFRLEYSLDRGENWHLIGDNTFYNYANTLSNGSTAFPYGEPYFAGNISSFTNYTLDISSLAGQSNVAFRFVFKSDGSVTDPGLAIDDFTITGPSTNLLPVILTSFDAKPQSDHALVAWQTAGIEDLDYFQLERSEDGFHFSVIAQRIGEKAEGDSYSFRDFNIGREIYYYRLKIVEKSGFAFYSDIRRVVFGQSDETPVIRPNPANDFAVVSLRNGKGRYRLKFFSMDGHLLFSRSLAAGDLESGFRMDLHDLPAGIYMLRIESEGDRVFNSRLVKY